MRSREGVMGFPLRLAIAFLIVSLCVPPLVAATEHFQTQTEIAAVDQEVGRISEVAARVYYAGAGSTCTLDVAIDAACTVVIGGENADAYSIAVFRGDTEQSRTYLDRPPVRLLGPAFAVNGPATLLFSCMNAEGIYGVEVSFVD